MNIYGKLGLARKIFHANKMEKSGKNKFAGFQYFELSDFLKEALSACEQAGITPVFTEFDGYYQMRFFDHDDEKGSIVFQALKPAFESSKNSSGKSSMNPAQEAGALITYFRRYLWQMAFEIIEADAIDSAEQTLQQARSAPPKPKVEKSDDEVLAWISGLDDDAFLKHKDALIAKRPHLANQIQFIQESRGLK